MVSQLAAVRAAVAVMGLGPEHGVVVAACEGLAEQIDAKPGAASLWREYLPAIGLLLTLGELEADDGQAALLELVRTPIRDAETVGARKSGAGGRGGGGKPRAAVDAVAEAGS